MEEIQNTLNIVWIILSAALVLFMQAGFTALESGKTRSKNTINVALKNMMDFVVAIISFWLIGYGLMFGTDWAGFIGTGSFLLDGLEQPIDYAIFVFQATFAATAATIISGGVSERMKFNAYAFMSLVVVALIYPISGHWIWSENGWLAQMGMIDFAGSTVVHSLGAWIALAGIILLGPRLGRFNRDGSVNPLRGHNLVLAVVGVIIIWFGWFGFNGGSTLEASSDIAKIILNTTLSAGAAGVMALILSWVMQGHVVVEKLLTGVVGGLVGITAGCAVVEPSGAVLIGFSTGALVYFAEWAMLKLKLDDPINVVASHGVAGLWGTLALALFAPVDNLPAGGHMAQLWIQFIGALSVFVWGFATGFILFWLLKVTNQLRVPPEGELMGLNVYEHGASSAMQDLMQSMKSVADTGNFNQQLKVEAGSDEAVLAEAFNYMTKEIHKGISEVNEVMQAIANGDFSKRVEAPLYGDLGKLKNEVNTSAESVDFIKQELEQVMQGMADGNFTVRMSDKIQGQLPVVVNQSLDGLQQILKQISHAVSAIADGELHERVEAPARGELQQIKNHINNSLEAIENIVDEIVYTTEQRALGELDYEIETDFKGKFAILKESVNVSGQKLRQVIQEIHHASLSLNQVSLESSEQSIQLSDASNEQLQTLEATRQNLNLLTSGLEASLQQSQQAIQLTGKASESSQQSNQMMEETIQAMHKVSNSSEQILEIITIMDSIAFQTNLLALNAAVEAARAGEAGRGFAVVAGEVRTLAQKSADASKNIKQLIESTVAHIHSGSRLIEKTGGNLSRMTQDFNDMGRLIEQIDLSSQHQFDQVHAVNESMQELDRIAGKNLTIADETSNRNHAVKTQAAQLKEWIRFFRIPVQNPQLIHSDAA